MDHVLTFPTKFAEGANSLGEMDSRHPTAKHDAVVLTLDEMLTTDFSTDTHFVSYFLVDPDGDLYARPVRGATYRAAPRVNKAALHTITKDGWRLVAWGAVLDYDLKDNLPASEIESAGKGWTQERLEDFTEMCREVREEMEDLGLTIHTIYRTNHGARFIHRYDQLIDVEEHERILEGIRLTYQGFGLKMDEACSDWTRLMRAPRVIRDGKPTWHADWFACGSDPDAWTITSTAPRAERQQAAAKVSVPMYAGAQPTPEECLAFFEQSTNGGNGAQKKTELYKKLKTKLKRIDDMHLYPALVDQAPYPFEHGQVNTDMARVVGMLCGRLYDESYMQGPEPIFALLLPGAEELPTDNPWVNILWSMCVRMWTGEAAQHKAKEIQEEEEEVEKKEHIDILLDHLRKLYPSTPIDLAWVMQHAMLKKGGSIYVMQADGTYDLCPTEMDVIPNTVRELDMEFLIALSEMSNNKVHYLTGRELMKMYGHRLVSIQGVPGSHDSSGGVLREGGVLRLPLFKPVNWERRFDEQIDAWLRTSLGRDYSKVMEWLSFASVWDKPIAGLAIIGPRSAGKSLLVDGLSELIAGAPQPAGASELVGEYTPGIGRTPILCVNEGAAVSPFKSSNMADRFRQMVTGDPLWANEKYKAQVEIRVPFRILFTANNMGVIDSLAEGQTLGVDDQEALRERLLLSRMTHAGTEWFATHNPGRILTNQWVGDDSQHLLARHLMHLYHTREEKYGERTGSRLLVEGTSDDMFDELGDRLRTGDRKTEEVMSLVHGILSMSKPPQQVCSAMSVDDEGVYITTSAIIQYHHTVLNLGHKVDLTDTSVGKCLGNISASQQAKRGKRMTLSGEVRNLNWHTLDLGLIERRAIDSGRDWDQIRKNIKRHVTAKA